jgi:hypothetical protein
MFSILTGTAVDVILFIALLPPSPKGELAGLLFIFCVSHFSKI